MPLYNRWKRRRSAPTTATIFGSALAFEHLLANFSNTAPATWSDATANALDAVDVSFSGFTSDANGVDFDGANNRLDITDATALDGNATISRMTIGLILRPDVATGNKCPMARSPSGAGPWSIQTNAAALRFHVGAPGASFAEAASVLAAATTARVIWDYYGGGATDADRLRCFVNGALGTMTYPTGSIPTTIADSSNILRYGMFTDGVQPYDGRIKYSFLARGHATSAQDITDLDAYMATL